MKWVILAVLGAILAFSISLMIRLGVFKDVQIMISNEPSLRLLYKDHIGPYHKIVPVIEEVEAWAKAHQLDCSRSFGKYLDNPEVVEESRLRSKGGCIVDSFPENLPEGFATELVEAREYIRAEFEGSPSIGPFKVYSPVRRLANEQRLKLSDWNLEIYHIQDTLSENGGMHTIYLFPFDK